MPLKLKNEYRPCPVRSACKAEADRAYYNQLFNAEWEVFVVRFDDHKKKFETATYCCVQAIPSK